MKQLAILMTLAGLCQAQDAKPTMIGPHRVGESFDEWMIAAKFDLAEICGQHPKSDKRMDFKAACKTLTTLKAGGKGWFRLEDYKNDATFTWAFQNSKTTTAESLHLTAAATVMAELAEAYGAATDSKIVPYQNALGAKWECMEASWILPDGAIIMAKETIGDRFTRWTTVKFYSAEAAAALIANQVKPPNPFIGR